jgi:hypothetical protein
MNTPFLRHLALGVLLSLPIIGGCKPADHPTPAAPGTNAAPGNAPAVTNAAAVPAGESTSKALTAEPVQPEVPFAVDRPLPENLNPSAPLKEVIKLAQAGVDEEVLLTFVNNTTSGFELGADEIIYLTDIGVSAPVINSMLARDQAMKTSRATTIVTAPAPAAAAPAIAAAPSYATAPAAAETEAMSAPLATEATENTFEEALSPYGTWIDVEGYGRCWQPTMVVVNRNWRPYCDGGRWVYTDSGWYWYSDYSWGWAPFHYGRWFSHPRWGWCWYPDYTWGYTDAYCGWAPLPPAAVYTGYGFTYCGSSVGVSFGFGLGYSCYSYVSWNHFCDYRPWRYCAPRPQCKEIYDRATCHNDYGTDHNRRAVNRGLPPDRVAAYSRTDVRRVSLREVTTARTTTGRGEELTRDGRTLEIRRPGTPAVARNQTAAVVTTPGNRRGTSGDIVPTPGNAGVGRGNQAGRSAGPSPVAGAANPQEIPAPAAETHASPAARTGHARPLVVHGQGDAQPQITGPWTAPGESRSRFDHSEQRIATAPANVETPYLQPEPASPPSTWTPPGRPDSGNASRSQIVRVGRGIEDRPAGGPAYRVYSSPQRETPGAPSYTPPPTVSSPAPEARAANSRPSSRANDDDNNAASNYQLSRQQPANETPKQVERPVERSAPSRPAQVESKSSSSRAESSRSESSRSDSRPTDSGRSGRR